MSTTQHSTPTHSRSKRFPSVGMEILSAIIHLVGVSTLAFLLAKKVHWRDLNSRQAIARMSWPRLLVILTVIDSWFFLFSTGILVNGTGMELSQTVCLLGILNCISFYATSKILIYLFLVEKVYVVWSGAFKKKRLRSPIYLICLAVVSVYVGVAILLIISRVAYFREDGSCVIGLTRPASLTLLVYDLAINVFLTSLFVWPLFNRKFNTPRIRRVAVRTLWAAGVALTTSCINILVLTIMHGKQLAWVCLASCGTDVVVNAIVLSLVTSGKPAQGGSGSDYDTPATDTKVLDSNIIHCTRTSDTDVGGSYKTHARRRTHSSPPALRARIGQLSRLFERRETPVRAVADPDVEHAAGEVVLEECKDDAADEDIYEQASREPLLVEPARAYTSTIRRSEQSLRHHLNDSQVQIHVTQETEIVVDDIPTPSMRRLRSWWRRNSENRISGAKVEGA
ncbi:hypothetical protein BC628DRAFT_1331572 [Trametes gibbosa]|nr:hypothetical protein BC628DRAFT_1331572 [Trametes gibbosa]